jgi:aldehyde:ferredoxin oxidoreductase
MNIMQPGSTNITSKVVRDIARAFWGSREAASYSTYEGKALAAKIILNRTYLKEILGLCDFAWPILYSFNTPDKVGDPELIGNIYEAVTGLPKKDLDLYAERLYNLQRIILLREGRRTPEADYPFEYNFTEPLIGKPGEPLVVLGPDDKPLDMKGNTLDRGKYLNMLKEYYRLRGWDENTGRPLPDTLINLGLNDLASAVK